MSLPRLFHRTGPAWLVLACVLALAATFGGASEFLAQVTAAPNRHASASTLILGFGLVLVGPSLFVAIVVLTAWQWRPHVLKTIRGRFGR